MCFPLKQEHKVFFKLEQAVNQQFYLQTFLWTINSKILNPAGFIFHLIFRKNVYGNKQYICQMSQIYVCNDATILIFFSEFNVLMVTVY